ncbi:hypothetical protein ADL25_40220 [Streptomyces sp. NRRL F-5122]|nr:hypothetical protein ADL25_40220 [Streptomyces sp. NRRL F-5122]
MSLSTWAFIQGVCGAFLRILMRWVVRAAVGWVMTPEDVDGACAISVTTKVYSLVNATVTTWKGLAATSPEA